MDFNPRVLPAGFQPNRTAKRSGADVLLGVGLVVVLALAVGCGRGSDLEKVIVSGEVTFKGEPVVDGNIRFHPMPGTKGSISGGPIRDGHYMANGRGGVPVGEHVVRITGYRSGNQGAGDDLMSMGGKKTSSDGQYIPRIYNAHSETVVTIDGEKSRATRDFHLGE